jgi:hypothetical protein
MKKCYSFILFFVLLFVQPLNSQIKIGFQIGSNFASGSYSNAYYPGSNVSGEIGLFGGFLAEFKLFDIFYLQPEINYIQKGVGLYPLLYSSNGVLKGDIKLDFFEIPINIIAKFKNEGWKPFLLAGPSLNFLNSAEKTKGNSGYIGSNTMVSKIEISLNIGGGAEYTINSGLDVFAMLRYSFGLHDIFDDVIYNYHTLSVDDTEYFKTSDLTLVLGIKF